MFSRRPQHDRFARQCKMIPDSVPSEINSSPDGEGKANLHFNNTLIQSREGEGFRYIVRNAPLKSKKVIRRDPASERATWRKLPNPPGRGSDLRAEYVNRAEEANFPGVHGYVVFGNNWQHGMDGTARIEMRPRRRRLRAAARMQRGGFPPSSSSSRPVPRVSHRSGPVI